MGQKGAHNWHFIDKQGTFVLENPQQNSYLYFPLVNLAGMKSSITPTLNGDANLDQNSFLLLPVSVEDLHNTRSGRNFWVRINGEPWSVTGTSAAQISRAASSPEEPANLKAGLLWHSVTRQHVHSGLTATVTNFNPAAADVVELMQITLTNAGQETLELQPTAAIPIFGRSADNLRDHRHVTALLHRTLCHRFGVLVKPTIAFDERGHQKNQVTYAVLGVDGDGHPPLGFTPLVEDFVGEGGCFLHPQAVYQDAPQIHPAATVFEGFESMGGLHFHPIKLKPGESCHYILMLCIEDGDCDVEALVDRYGTAEKFAHHLRENQVYWEQKLSMLRFIHQDERLDGWLRWVTLQPTLRRIMGNSFLPYHDYGRGGRGWRDLWQDLLTLLLTEIEGVRELLLGNFAGVRIDGSNATIVGNLPGEFKADRNSIPRVWMDHGAWPLITTKLYLDLAGDIGLLLEPQPYFQDHFSHRCQRINTQWRPEQGTLLTSVSGEVVQGSILEHLLVQHLTAFFHVGEHHLIRLEGGDWNDAFDMAPERGESVAFSALYAGNLHTLSTLCQALVAGGQTHIELAEELVMLLDRIAGPVDYAELTAKQARLQAYFDRVAVGLSGEKVTLALDRVAADLQEKAAWLSALIRQQEWLEVDGQGGWFNGYYDNEGQRVEGLFDQGVRMTLTGQVFPLMAAVATEEQARAIVKAADAQLFDQHLNSYRLNTDFGSDPPKLGRAFGFAYGHKENGAVFSHMAVMYAYALYRQGLAAEAWQVLAGLFNQSKNFPVSRIYPGIPEYFNPRGRGMYPYLTGSAAWYLYTLLTEAFGVQGQLGDLYIAPKLVAEQFAHGEHVEVHTLFAGKQLQVTFSNPHRLTYGNYYLGGISINGVEKTLQPDECSILITRQDVLAWPDQTQILIELIEPEIA